MTRTVDPRTRESIFRPMVAGHGSHSHRLQGCRFCQGETVPGLSLPDPLDERIRLSINEMFDTLLPQVGEAIDDMQHQLFDVFDQKLKTTDTPSWSTIIIDEIQTTGNTVNITGGSTGSATLNVIGDSHTREASPNTNYGNSTTLSMDGAASWNNRRFVWLQFPLSSVPAGATLSDATVRLYLDSGFVTTAITVSMNYVSDVTWTELGIKWNNQPAISTLTTELAVPGATDVWYEWNVLKHVERAIANGLSTISLEANMVDDTTHSWTRNWRSSEHASAPEPELVISWGTNPDLAVPGDIVAGGDVTAGGDAIADSFQMRDSDESHLLSLLTTSDLSADRDLTLVTGDADRTVTLTGDPTLADWFDQGVKTTDSPTFAGLNITGHITIVTLAVTGLASISTLYADWASIGELVASVATFSTVEVTDLLNVSGELRIQTDKIVYADIYTDEGVDAVIDQLGAEGGLGILPEGSYTVDAPVTIDQNNTWLEGGGWGAVLDASGWVQTDHVLTLSGKTDCMVRDMQMVGKAGGGAAKDLIYASTAHRLNVVGNYLKEADQYCLKLDDTDDCLVAFNWFDNPDSHGLNAANSEYGRLIGNHFDDAYAYLANSCDVWAIVGNTTHTKSLYIPAFSTAAGNACHNPDSGIYLTGSSSVMMGNAVWGGGYGAYRNGDRQVITGNMFYQQTYSAVRMNAGTDSGVVSGNLMFQSGNNQSDIWMMGTNDRTAIVGNTGISGAGQSERMLGATNSDDCTFVGNVSTLHDTEGMNLDVDCSGWVVIGNRFTEGTRITNAGSNNIIFDHDTANMITYINHSLALAGGLSVTSVTSLGTVSMGDATAVDLTVTGLTSVSTINVSGLAEFAAAAVLDLYSNGGYLKPRRVRQAAEPVPDANELMLWSDSDDDAVRLLYNDATAGVVSVELT